MKVNFLKKTVLAGALTLALALTGCGSGAAPAAGDNANTSAPADSTNAGETNAGGEAKADVDLLNNYSPENPVTVKVGLTAAIYEDIWDPIKEELAGEGINIEYVQFSDYTLPNEALENGEINLTAQQHHAYMENQTKENGWDDLVPIGDTFIIAMNLYSNKITDVSQFKDGDTIAVPNDLTNEGRALKLLANAGLFTFKEGTGNSPEVKDIETYNVKIELVEVNASETFSVLPDVTASVINGNYALDAGIDPTTQGIFFEEKYDSNSYFCLIGARKAEADSKAYKRIVEAFQSEGTKKIFQDEFKGYFKPAWEYKIEE